MPISKKSVLRGAVEEPAKNTKHKTGKVGRGKERQRMFYGFLFIGLLYIGFKVTLHVRYRRAKKPVPMLLGIADVCLGLVSASYAVFYFVTFLSGT